MAPNERADLSAGPSAAASDSTTRPRDDRFAMVPVRIRREHRDWTDGEHAVWLDLFLASYEIGGRFESRAMLEAFIGDRRMDPLGAWTVDKLIERGAIVEDDDGLMLADYVEAYDGRMPRGRKSLVERLADAEAKIEAGEPLSGAERVARHRARQDGADLPDPRRNENGEGIPRGKTKTEVTVTETLPNDPTPILGDLYKAFTQLTGLPCEHADKSRIDNLCRNFDRDLVRTAMYADPEPSRNPDKFIGRTFHRLKEGTVAA